MTPQEVDETLRIFAQSRVILEQYHAAMQQAQPPIVTRCWTHTTRLAAFIATLPADAQQRIDELTQQLLAEWERDDPHIMRKKLRRACRLAQQPKIRKSVADSLERSLVEHAALWRDLAQY